MAMNLLRLDGQNPGIAGEPVTHGEAKRLITGRWPVVWSTVFPKGQPGVNQHNVIYLASNTEAYLRSPRGLKFPKRKPAHQFLGDPLAQTGGWGFYRLPTYEELRAAEDYSLRGVWESLGQGAGMLGKPLTERIAYYQVTYDLGYKFHGWAYDHNPRLQFAIGWFKGKMSQLLANHSVVIVHIADAKLVVEAEHYLITLESIGGYLVESIGAGQEPAFFGYGDVNYDSLTSEDSTEAAS